MEISNERLLVGARNLKKKGYSPEEVDAWLQTKGSSLDAMKSFATQQKQAKLPQVSDKARAEINANIEAYENPSWLKRLKNAAEISHASNEGFIEGIDNALNRATNAVTLGAFNKASQLTGGNEYLKDRAIRERNESEGLGVADTLSGLAVEIPANLATTGSAMYDTLGKLGVKGVTQMAGAAGIEGALGNAIQSEKLEDVPVNAFAGGVTGSVLSMLPATVLGGYDLVKKVARPSKYAIKQALERISELAGGSKKVSEAATEAATRNRSALEVGGREIAQAADQARLGSREANEMLNTFVDAERAAKADANRKVIDDVFGSRTKAQNTDAIIERTKKIAAPIYDKLNKVGDLRYVNTPKATSYKGSDEVSVLKSMRRNLEKGDPNFSMAKTESGSIDYPHFVSDNQRTRYITTMPSTLRNPDEVVSGMHGGLPRDYYLKKYYNPENSKDVYDMAIKSDDGALINKLAREGRTGAREFEKVRQARISTDGTTSQAGLSEGTSIPVGLSGNSISDIGNLVKKNDFIKREIGKVRADTTWDKAIREAPDTDFRLLDAVKKNIDDQIEVAKRAGENDKVMRLQIQKTGLVNAMDQVVPEYKTARQAYEIKGKVLSAQKIGENSMDNKVTAETLGRKMREMSPAERQAVGIGMKEQILSNLGSKENEALALRSLLNKNSQDKLRLALGRRQANNIIDYAKDEVSAYRNFNEALKGSQTAERLNASKKVNLIQNILKNPVGIVGEVLDYASKPSENATNKAIVELLTEKGGAKLNQALIDDVADKASREMVAKLLAVLGGKAGSEF